MKRILIFSLPIITLIFFFFIMTSANFLKQPTGEDDNLLKIIDEIKIDVNNGDWNSAENKNKSLYDAWQKICKRVQFSAERNELKDGDVSIARINGYIEARDKSGVLSELSELKEHWVDIGK